MTPLRAAALSLLAPATALLGASPAHSAGPAAQPQPDKVTVELYADVAAIGANATFHLAVQYDIAKDWHIYWVNPGDTGFATSLEVKAPENFIVGPVQYPGPHRFEQPGDLVSFGYEEQATLIVEIKAPQTLRPDEEFTFEIRSDWLVCKEACMAGSAEKSITLKSKVFIEEPEPAAQERFKKALARLPQPLKELKIGQTRWQGSKSRPRFEATFPEDVEFEVFPLIVEGAEAHEPEVMHLGDGSSRLSITFDVDESRAWPAGPRPLAVLRVQGGDEEKFYDLVPKFD